MNYGENLRNLMAGIYTQQELDRIADARISISGVGGSAGSYLVDVLARKGFEHYTLSEPEDYDLRNISRQLFANMTTIGKRKLDTTVEYLHKINPDIDCLVYEKVDVSTIDDTIKGCTVVAYQAEGFSPWVLTNHVCSKHRVPFVNVSRKKNANNLRSIVAVTVIDYRKLGVQFDCRNLDFSSFGIPDELAQEVVKMCKDDCFDQAILDHADHTHAKYKKNKRFEHLGQLYPEVGDIKDRYPFDYPKRYTDPEICLLAGALGSRAVTDIVIGRTTQITELDIFSRPLVP